MIMIKIDKIIENYPELDSTRMAELKEELLNSFCARQRNFTEWLRKNFQNNIDDECLWEDSNMIIDRPPQMYTTNELINFYDQYIE